MERASRKGPNPRPGTSSLAAAGTSLMSVMRVSEQQ
jgi:hypothetical protein